MTERRLLAIDPAPGRDAQILAAWAGEDGVLHLEPAKREEIAEVVRRMTEAFRPVAEAMRAQAEALWTALRPLAETLAELHRQFPDPADWEIEPEPESCHHLCGREFEHECLGEADGTFAYNDGGRQVPMCAPCQRAAVAVLRIRQGRVHASDFGAVGDGIADDTAAIQAAVDAVTSPRYALDTLPYSGAIYGGGYEAPARSGPAGNATDERIDWGLPLTASDANWPADASRVCAHVCGPDPDHACDARATEQLNYRLPSGGNRSMPLCAPCHASETAEAAHAR